MKDIDSFDKWSIAIAAIIVIVGFFILAFLAAQQLNTIIEEVDKFNG